MKPNESQTENTEQLPRQRQEKRTNPKSNGSRVKKRLWLRLKQLKYFEKLRQQLKYFEK